VFAGIFTLLRQPSILAYLFAGIVLEGLGVLGGQESETFSLFAHLGIMFLLFLIGLEINYASLRLVGKISLLLGIGQVVFTSVIGFVLAMLFHFSALASLFIAIALTFSSTIIVVKILSERKDTNSLYGKISIGMLLTQDFLAIIALLLLSSLARPVHGIETIAQSVFAIVKGACLFGSMVILGRASIPRLFRIIGRSDEMLFLGALAWLFVIVVSVGKLGFSLEMGGFLAGIGLANSSEQFHIASRLRPLRDFFILIFFVTLGSSLAVTSASGLLLPIAVLSLFVLVGNPCIVMALMSVFGYQPRTSFFTGLTVAQISEFSFILMALGFNLGHIDQRAVSLVSWVGVITIGVSTLMMEHAQKLYSVTKPVFRWMFRRRALHEETAPKTFASKSFLLIGYHRTGQRIARHLPVDDVLVIDFDPEMVQAADRDGITSILGDSSDQEVIERIDWNAARVVITTSPDFHDTMDLIRTVQKRVKHATTSIIVARADNESDEKLLRDSGAHIVFYPERIAGDYLGRQLARSLKNPSNLTSLTF